MRHFPEPQRLAHLAPLGEERHDAPIIRLQELPQDQHGEQLRLREVVPRARARIPRERAPAHEKRFAGEAHRRLRHRTHAVTPGVLPRRRATARPRHSFQQSKMSSDLEVMR